MDFLVYLGFFLVPSLHPLYLILFGGPFLLALFAQMMVKGAYTRFSRVEAVRGYTGARAAARILEGAGIYDVSIERVQGWLSDHYDPARKVLRLSPQVHDGRSIASVGIAAHEAGHALQHATGYAPLQLRSMLVPTAGLGSCLALPMIIVGLLINLTGLALLGVILFSALVIFQIITLPVEFNASTRAKQALQASNIIVGTQEMSGVSSILNAAAMTYVAATIAAVAQLLYFLLHLGLLGGGGDE